MSVCRKMSDDIFSLFNTDPKTCYINSSIKDWKLFSFVISGNLVNAVNLVSYHWNAHVCTVYLSNDTSFIAICYF